MGLTSQWQATRRWYYSLGWVRRRILLIMVVLAGSWIITGILIYVLRTWLLGEFVDDTLRGIFGAFVGELIFFSIVGGAVTVVSLRNPMEEGFEGRLRILYRGAPIPEAVSKYNRSEISRLSGYVKKATRTVTVESYDSVIKAYKVKTKTVYLIQNLLPDVRYEDSVRINIKPYAFTETLPELGRIISIKIGGVETIRDLVTIEKDGFTTQVKLEIEPNQLKEVLFEYSTWLKIDQPQLLRPQRVVEQFLMDIVSQCDQSPRVEIDGDPRGVVSLLFNQSLAFQPRQGVLPNEKVCSYKLLSPTGT